MVLLLLPNLLKCLGYPPGTQGGYQPNVPEFAPQWKNMTVMTVAEDDAFIMKSQCCMMEMYFIHPQSYLVLWSKSVNVFGLQKKNTGGTVFNISPIEPVLDSFQSQFLVNFRYTIDQGETMELKTTCDLLSPKTKKGYNTITVEQGSHTLAISFNYQGYNETKNSFSLQNLSFTLFTKPIKVHRPPTNRPYSMDLNGKSLKINSHSFRPSSKATSSMTLNTYVNKDPEDLKGSKGKYHKEKDKILKKSSDELCEVIKDSNGSQQIIFRKLYRTRSY